MRNWQNEIRNHCKMKAALTFLGFRDKDNEPVDCQILAIGSSKKYIVDITCIPMSGYSIIVYWRDENGIVSKINTRLGELSNVHGFIDNLIADFDIFDLI
jgi:hypothetical protein